MQQTQVSLMSRVVCGTLRKLVWLWKLVWLLGSVILLHGATAHAQQSFQADWFFPDRPKELVGLEGKAAPDLVTQAWIGDEVKLKAQRGKVVVVDFWATWCGPCMAAIPENVELVDEFKEKGLVFVGVHDANSGWDQAPSVVKSKKINYSVAHDKGESAKAYNVGFWPTYVVIDRKGVVRAAGLIPSHVKDVVKVLLAEAGPVEPAGASSGNPAGWYVGGGSRPAVLAAAEGKKLPEEMGKNWIGKAIERTDLKDKVTVITFFAADSALAGRTLEKVKELDGEFASQGVAFLGVCDARMEWERAKKLIEARTPELGVPVMQDLPVAQAVAVPGGAEPAVDAPAEGVGNGEGGEVPVKGGVAGVVGGANSGAVVVAVVPAMRMTAATPIRGGVVRVEETEPEGEEAEGVPMEGEGAMAVPAPKVLSGQWAAELGIRLSPVTVVVDRRGVVRAAGVKAEALKEIIGALLAEPAE